MTLHLLTNLAFQLNALIDGGHLVSVSDITNQIELGTIFDFLKIELSDDIDFSLHSSDVLDELVDEWQRMHAAINEGKKFGVTKNGFCLLLAYILEGIQTRYA